MTIDIRQVNFENADLLNRIAPEVFDNPIDPVQLQAFLNDPRHVLFVAVEHDTVVGMASAFEYFHPDKPPQLFVNEVGVAMTHRKQGIGRNLVEALIRFAERRNCAYAWLGTDTDNEPAQACFGSVREAKEPQEFLLYEWDLET